MQTRISTTFTKGKKNIYSANDTRKLYAEENIVRIVLKHSVEFKKTTHLRFEFWFIFFCIRCNTKVIVTITKCTFMINFICILITESVLRWDASKYAVRICKFICIMQSDCLHSLGFFVCSIDNLFLFHV